MNVAARSGPDTAEPETGNGGAPMLRIPIWNRPIAFLWLAGAGITLGGVP